MTSTLSRRTTTLLAAATGLILLAVILLAAVPVGWLRPLAERQIARQTGSAVRIGAIAREDAFSFRPVIRLSDVHVGQPAWAGSGDLASIGLLRLRVGIWPLLWGRVDSDVLTAQHVRLNLIRAADGRENWRKDRAHRSGGGRGAMAVGRVEDAVIRYTDARQKRSAVLSLRITPDTGLRVEGTGTVDGAPVRLRAAGPPMTQDRAWPFSAAIDGPALAMHIAGRMAAPLRTDAMDFRMTARADDLKRVDRVIEAGLFGTQPVDLTADVAHADAIWTIKALNGTIGRSIVTGHATARLIDGRTKLDADIRFPRLDFDDLASDKGQAKAIALERTEGLRLVPNTRINIYKINHTDGRIAIRADRIMSGRRPSSILSLDGVLNLDHRLLTIDPLRIGLRQGAITGHAIVDQHDGGPHPRVTLALDLDDSRIAALAGGGDSPVDGRVDARVRLVGMGDTIRAAVGASDGTIGIAARAGTVPRTIAAIMGFDIGKAVFGGDGDRPTSLRCAAIRLAVRKGRGAIETFVADTSISQTTGRGTISFPSEALAIALSGAPKNNAALRLPEPVQLTGTIREPHIQLPGKGSAIGTLFKAIGHALSGDDGPTARDADCTALIRRALR